MAKSNIKVTFLCPAEKVWRTVTDLLHYGWRSDLEKIEMIDGRSFVEVTKDGIRTTFTVIEKRELELWEFDLENENMKGHWTGKFLKHGEKTTLDFTEDVTAKKLFLKPVIGIYLRKQQRQYFADLKKELGCREAGGNKL